MRLLKPQDRLAVVCYDDEVDTVLARTPASPEAKALALERLAQHRRARLHEPRRAAGCAGGGTAAERWQPLLDGSTDAGLA